MHTNGYHSHTHNHCKHDSLQYCSHCDIVYCENCGREWGQKVTVSYTYEPYIWTYRGIPYTVTYNNSGQYTLTTSNGTVVTRNDIVSAFTANVSNSNTVKPNNPTHSYHSHNTA